MQMKWHDLFRRPWEFLLEMMLEYCRLKMEFALNCDSWMIISKHSDISGGEQKSGMFIQDLRSVLHSGTIVCLPNGSSKCIPPGIHSSWDPVTDGLTAGCTFVTPMYVMVKGMI